VLSGSQFDTDEDRLDLWSDSRESIWLSSDGPLRTATRLALRGTTYETEIDAYRAGERALAALRIAFIRTMTPADFLERTLMGGMSEEALAAAQQAVDRVQADEPSDAPRLIAVPKRSGVIVHPSDEQHLSFQTSGTATVTKSASGLAHAYQDAVQSASVDRGASLAFDLWSASVRMPSIDSRFLTLVNAIEALIEQRPTAGPELEAVEQLQAAVNGMELEEGSRSSLHARIDDFRRESIGRAGRRLMRRLDPELYDGQRATQFFTGVYEMRSRLTHGDDAPPHPEIANASVELDRLVRDLIASRLSRGGE